MSDEERISEAYGRYDSDPRVSGVDDMDAFRDAVRPLTVETTNLRTELKIAVDAIGHHMQQVEALKAENKTLREQPCVCPFCNYHRQFDEDVTTLPEGVPVGSVWNQKEQRWVHPDAQEQSGG